MHPDTQTPLNTLLRIASFPATPLLRFKGLSKPGVEIFAKAEWYNPSGSVKFRPALNIVEEGEKSGQLTKSKIIIDASSGNTGVAYAVLGQLKGYAVELVMPKNVADERRNAAEKAGAKIIFSDPLAGSDGAIILARKRVKENPEKYFYADQYFNEHNWKAHYQTTALEILWQTQNRITHFVAGLGTTGTFMGTSRRLKAEHKKIQAISMEPEESLHGMEGLKHMATAIVPGIYDPKLADRHLFVDTDAAYEMQAKLQKQSGLHVGTSAAGALVAASRIASEISQGVMVTILPAGDDTHVQAGQKIFEVTDWGAYALGSK